MCGRRDADRPDSASRPAAPPHRAAHRAGHSLILLSVPILKEVNLTNKIRTVPGFLFVQLKLSTIKEKTMRKTLFTLFAAFMIVSMLAACGPAATPQVVIQTSVVKETSVVVQTQQVVATKLVQVTAVPTVRPTLAPGAALPRTETLYFNGQQWGAVVCWNPYSSNCNNAMAVVQQDSARVTMFESPYLFDMLDVKVYPLLADGPFAWNAAHTEITFKRKKVAHWSDGTPVTADDVASTWDSPAQY